MHSDSKARAAAAGHGRLELLLAVGLFGLLSLAVLGWIHGDLRPAPLYPVHESHARAPAVYVAADLPIELRLSLPEPAERLLVPVLSGPGSRPLRIQVDGAGEGGETQRLLADVEVTRSGVIPLELGRGPGAPRELRIRFASDAESQETAPGLLWAVGAPVYPIALRYGGKPLSSIESLPQTGPLVLVEYAWPSRALLGLWILVSIVAVLVWRDPKRAVWLLVILALAASASSALRWQRDYTRRVAQRDADLYTQSASNLARYLVAPEERPEIREWYRTYPHSSTSLAPALMAVPVALGAPATLVYLELSALAGLLSLLVFHRILRVELRYGARLAMIGAVLLGTHLLMLRSFARPVTDVFGLLLVLLTMGLLSRRLRGEGRWEEAGLSLLLLAHPLARPQGLGYWPFIAAALVACDVWRAGGRIDARQLIGAGLRIFGPPLLLLAALYIGFGWLDNVELMLAKARRFRINSTLPIFLQSIAGLVQLLPLLWLRAGSELRRPGVLLWIAWGLYGVALLVAVRAPFWMRHFLPVLPAVIVLAVAGLDRLEGRGRLGAGALVVLYLAGNVGITVHQIFHFEPLPRALEGLVGSN